MARRKKGYVNRSSRKPSAFVPALVILALSLTFSFTGAYAWQTLSGDTAKLEAKQSMSSLLASSSSASQPAVSSSTEEGTSSQNSAASSSEEVPDASQEQAAAPAGAVPESERVKSDYFDDAMFVGDSITNGILSYQLMENAKVVSYTGINPDTIRTEKVYRNSDGELITILQAMAENSERTKIYILLGSNGIAWLDQQHFIESYEAFLGEVKAQHPNAIIYVQSIPPINESLFPQHYNGDITNEKIDAYNADIAQMAQRAGVYYLNIAQALKDESGGLPEEATSDGMHFTAAYYQKWFDYLKTHTVEGSSTVVSKDGEAASDAVSQEAASSPKA